MKRDSIINSIKKLTNQLLDRLIYYFRNKHIIINGNYYEWISAPTPADCPSQSQTHPSICYIPKGWNGKSHWLATTPYPDYDYRFENPCIYHSIDITNTCPSIFLPISSNPIYKWQGGISYNSDVELFFSNDILFSLIRESCSEKYLNEIKVQYSNNGEEWSSPKHITGSNDPDKLLISPSVIQYNDKIRIYTLNYDTAGRVGRFTGLDIYEGTSLMEPDFKMVSSGSFANNRELKIEPWHFSLFIYDSKLYMIFCAYQKRINNIRNSMNTYLAVSTDFNKFRIFKSPIVHSVRNYRPTAYVDKNENLVLLFSVIGNIYQINADRAIGKTIFKIKELIDLLEYRE